MIGEPTSILAFRNGSIGNTLVAVPALRAIRKRYPHAMLSVVVDPTGFELLEHCPWIDDLIVYDKRGKDRGFAAHVRLVRRLRKLRPSHAVLFKRFFRNGLLAYLSGAKVRAGFETNDDAPFLNLTVPYEADVNIVDLNLQLAALLGAQTNDRRPSLYLTDNDRRQALGRVGEIGPYWAVHYGGATTAPDFIKTSRFAELLKASRDNGCKLVFIGSGKTERESAEVLASALAGETAMDLPLRVTAAVIERAALFVGFNSGPAHIAAAVGTPEVVFYQPLTGAEKEILKWKPASPRCMTLVPPATDDDRGWDQFRERFRLAAHEMSKAVELADKLK